MFGWMRMRHKQNSQKRTRERPAYRKQAALPKEPKQKPEPIMSEKNPINWEKVFDFVFIKCFGIPIMFVGGVFVLALFVVLGTELYHANTSTNEDAEKSLAAWAGTMGVTIVAKHCAVGGDTAAKDCDIRTSRGEFMKVRCYDKWHHYCSLRSVSQLLESNSTDSDSHELNRKWRVRLIPHTPFCFSAKGTSYALFKVFQVHSYQLYL